MITGINTESRLSEHFTLAELTKTKTGNNEDFDELIIERKGYTYWIHFAVRPSDNRKHTNFKR